MPLYVKEGIADSFLLKKTVTLNHKLRYREKPKVRPDENEN